MKHFLSILISIMCLIPAAFAQDLLKERIWKLAPRKKSIFLDKGVFHSPANPQNQRLKSIRNSYVPARGYERVVLDFTGSKPPRIYGHISKREKKVYIDFFNVSAGKMDGIRNVKFLKEVNFFNIDEDHISAELSFKQNVSFDIFYLVNPARLVIDIKK